LVKRILLLLVLSQGVIHTLCAQRFFNGKREMGIFIGGSNYQGDIAPKVVWNNTGIAFGPFFRYNFNPYVCYRVQASYGKIQGADSNFAPQANRNLSFHSDIIEASQSFEFNFHRFGINVLDKDFTPFLSLGLSVFYFNPKADYGVGTHSLRKLHTEGQKRSYSTLQVAVPIGFGFKYNLSRNCVAGVEGVWRRTFTDYLDDVKGNYPDFKQQQDQYGDLSAELSHRETALGKTPYRGGTQRGDQHLRDWYFFLGFTLSYRFTPVICRLNNG